MIIYFVFHYTIVLICGDLAYNATIGIINKPKYHCRKIEVIKGRFNRAGTEPYPIHIKPIISS